MESVLQQKINYLRGVGDYRAELLDKELGIRTYEDLLYSPFRYVDRTRVYRIELRGDENHMFSFESHNTHLKRRRWHKQRLRVVVDDGTGR